MNYLDLLPNDITKIINRKVQDLHIIERRKERKENRKMNRVCERALVDGQPRSLDLPAWVG